MKKETDIIPDIPIGSRVRIKKDSSWYREGDPHNPAGVIGVFDNYNKTAGLTAGLSYLVTWPTGRVNGYRITDLELVEETSMTKEEIITGEIYYAKYKGTQEDYIYEAPKGVGYNGYLHPKTKKYYSEKDSSHDWTHSYDVRLATSAEAAHFRACQAAKKYVPAPVNVVINDYQIY